MVPKFRVEFWVYIFLALGLLMLPFSWILGAVLAAAFHELCHFTAAKVLGIFCSEIHIGTGGMVMHMQNMTLREELLVSSAGPLGSLLLGLLVHRYPQLAVCGLVQGLFNLLPIYPLDGGRIVNCLLGEWGMVCKFIEGGAILGILMAGLILSFYLGFDISPILLALAITGKAIIRKFPCKELKLRVQ